VALGESVYIGGQLVLIYILGTAFGNIGLAYSMLLSFSIQSIFIMLIVKIKHIIA
jgi:hypothetical protein